MIRLKSGKLLVIASPESSVPLPHNKEILHIANADRFFPVIHEQKPDAVMLDYDYLGAQQTERILRRLTGNPFYHKIKINCYKAKPQPKADDLLKTWGVQNFVYDTLPEKKNQTVKLLREMIEAQLVHTLVEASI